ncbi:hypothetical protein [Nocardia brasiliensis]|uniref:hypothetical protein n=1 Tax=Nocardia brasiliensis TaxID=37326 RepID=UPI0024560BE8|nr:hypothetical protein [Nocardia brasiliensis]
MPAAPKKTTAKVAAKVTEPALSRFAQLEREATATVEPKPDYMFDGTNPPTPIKEPVTAEQVTAFAQLFDQRGGVDVAHLRDLFAAVCGDAFEPVWAVVGRKHFNVLMALIGDINDHFNTVPGAEGDDLPGGA